MEATKATEEPKAATNEPSDALRVKPDWVTLLKLKFQLCRTHLQSAGNAPISKKLIQSLCCSKANYSFLQYAVIIHCETMLRS